MLPDPRNPEALVCARTITAAVQRKLRVFISFDYENDRDIKGSLVHQLENESYIIKDMSIQYAVESKWKDEARNRIKGSDLVIVLCGKHTDEAKGVSAEITIAQEQKIPYVMLKGHKSDSVRPDNVLSDEGMLPWNSKTLKSFIRFLKRP